MASCIDVTRSLRFFVRMLAFAVASAAIPARESPPLSTPGSMLPAALVQAQRSALRALHAPPHAHRAHVHADMQKIDAFDRRAGRA